MSDKLKSLSEIDFTPAGKVFPSPSDWRDQFIYFLLIDRFNNGDKKIPAYDPAVAVNDRADSDGEQWQGGTLNGIKNRLDYIKNLGCTAIWLSPVFRNRKEMNTYHGYAIQNFLDVDPRFGTITDLQKLVQTAHKKGM
jgi:glycosidase